MTEQNLISTAQAAELSGLSQPQIQKLCRDGVIPAQKVGSTYVIPAEWATQFADTVGPGVAARAAGVSRQTIYTAIADGTLVTVMGNRIAKSSLAEYIRAREGEKWLNKPYLWGRVYTCMLEAVKKGAPDMLRGFEKHYTSYTRSPWKDLGALVQLYRSALRGLPRQEKDAAELLLTALMGGLDCASDGQRCLTLPEQADLNIGIIHGRGDSSKGNDKLNHI